MSADIAVLSESESEFSASSSASTAMRRVFAVRVYSQVWQLSDGKSLEVTDSAASITCGKVLRLCFDPGLVIS